MIGPKVLETYICTVGWNELTNTCIVLFESLFMDVYTIDLYMYVMYGDNLS